MSNEIGAMPKDIKTFNSCLMLKLICTNPSLSRLDLKNMTGLSAVTAGKIVSELIAKDIICEKGKQQEEKKIGSRLSAGRRPIPLELSQTGPCVCGVCIFKTQARVVLTDLKARIFASERVLLEDGCDEKQLTRLLNTLYETVTQNCRRKILGIGISAIGPVDTKEGKIFSPVNFFGIQNFPVCDIFKKKTGLPVFLVNEPGAAALAEKLYGNAKKIENFLFVSLFQGIGAGIVLDGKLYQGKAGTNGELGHVSVDLDGPACECGNSGCLELYVSEKAMKNRAGRLLEISGKTFSESDKLTFSSILECASKGDVLASELVGEYCEYLSHALTNILNLFDFETIILGCGETPTSFLADILSKRINQYTGFFLRREVGVQPSRFGNDAAAIGAAALVASKVFSGDLPI